MRFGSLFTGIGGFDEALERAGMECAWQVEIDAHCHSARYRMLGNAVCVPVAEWIGRRIVESLS